jgi:LAGLIDADG DNA endonuclease family
LIDYKISNLLSHLKFYFYLIIVKEFNEYKYYFLYTIKNPIPQTNVNNRIEENNSNLIRKKIELNYKLGPDGKTPLSDYINQALVGLLLGDGTLVKKYKGGGTYFKYSQSTVHSEYLFFFMCIIYLKI